MADEKKLSNSNKLGEDKSSENSDPLIGKNDGADTDAIENDISNNPLPVVPSIHDDYKMLLELNLFKLVLIKFQRDAHPNKEIDSLLNRRIHIQRSDFEGPFIVRVISSILMILISGTIAWGVLWLIGSAMGNNSFLRELAGAMSIMIATTFGIALFQPFHLIDERSLKLALNDELLKLKCLIQEEEDEGIEDELSGMDVDDKAEDTLTMNLDEYDPKMEDTIEDEEENTEVS